MTAEQVAEVAHEVNAAYCRSQLDLSQLPWPDAPAWQRESALKGVRAILGNPGMHPSESHKSWMAEKLANGWTYGTEKDPEKKTHPCLCDYEKLPAAQQAKDWIFTQVVKSLAMFVAPQPTQENNGPWTTPP